MNTIALILLPFSIVGLFTFYHLLRKQHEPADKSNRINAIRLWWFALTREEKFTDLYKVGTGEPAFPWLKNDEWDNIEGEE